MLSAETLRNLSKIIISVRRAHKYGVIYKEYCTLTNDEAETERNEQ